MALNPQEYNQVSHLELIARQVVEGFITGLHKSPFHGFSVEFAEHRIYNTGEPTRHIDWKLFGRTDKLFTKRYEEETNLRCQLVVDNSASMHFPEFNKKLPDVLNKITFSSHCAAAIIQLLKMQRDAAGLSIFSDKLEVSTAARSSSVHHKLLLHKLEEAIASKGSGTTALAQALHQIAEKVHRRSLVIIFSDMFENAADGKELFSALQHLRYNKHEVILFHVVDKRLELDFNFENRPYQFVDIESGQEVKVHAATVREAYLKNMDAYRKELMLKCAQYRIDFIEADVNKGYKQVLMPYLMKRGKMF
jgi:uncharacterized protein (DUF58 family)